MSIFYTIFSSLSSQLSIVVQFVQILYNSADRKTPGECMKNFYTAREAMEKLGLKKSTFYDLIKRGDIPEGIVLPLRRHALYPKTTIDDLAEERARILGEYEQEPERLQFMIPTPEDFEQIVAIDSALCPERYKNKHRSWLYLYKPSQTRHP